jgi:hypothetical protein
MHNEEAEAILYREMLERDGAMEALRRNPFPSVLIGDDRRSILLLQGHLDGFVIRLWVPDDAMTGHGERRQKI